MSTPVLERSAVISGDGRYRYELRRVWNSDRPTVGWIMLNPSTADADHDDPTIRRCVSFARAWGYGGIVVRNLFAYRATDPRALRFQTDPVGPANDEHLMGGAHGGDGITICAWGAHGTYRNRDLAVVALLCRDPDVRVHHLGLTKDGAPRHPLYVRGDTPPTEWAMT